MATTEAGVKTPIVHDAGAMPVLSSRLEGKKMVPLFQDKQVA